MEWITGNWEYVLAAFYVAEKIVKLTPTDKDDILFDMIFDVVGKLAGKKASGWRRVVGIASTALPIPAPVKLVGKGIIKLLRR